MSQSGDPDQPGDPEKTRPRTNGDLKRHLMAEHGCAVEDCEPLFKGADNQDGPLLHRMVGPKGGSVPNIDDFPDHEEVKPSTLDYFCRRLGLEPENVCLDGPGGLMTAALPSVRAAKAANKVRPITSAAGHRRATRPKKR
jgi:hypothetical protein